MVPVECIAKERVEKTNNGWKKTLNLRVGAAC